AYSGEGALRAAESEQCGLALVDIRLAGQMNGIDLAAILKQRFDVPVVFITAHTDEETISAVKATEPLAFLAKPVGDSELAAAVEIGLYRYRAEKARRQAEERAKRLELQILELEKKAAIAQLASGVAHDLNNSLTIAV